MPKMSLGSRIREARIKLGWKQRQLASHFGIEPPSVSDWERDVTRPDPARYPDLARVLNVSLDWLLDDGEPPAKSAKSANLSTNAQPKLNESAKNHTIAPDLGVHSNVGRRIPAPQIVAGERDLPVWGTAVCGEEERGDFRFNGEVVDHVRRPARLSGVKKAFVVYTVGTSMEPRYFAGDPAYIHPGQPVRPGDVVLVELHPEREGEAGAAILKVLVAKTATKYRLKQYNPPNDRIEIEERRVKQISRVVPYGELLGL